MNPKLKRELLKSVKKTALSKWYDVTLKASLLWIDVKYGFLNWFFLKTWKFRLKHSKFVILSSMAYHTPTGTWDDVDVADQWGNWLPLGFGICSRLNWEFDNEINVKIGEPEEPWQDVSGDEDWKTYWFRDDYLDSKHYIAAARRHLKEKIGDAIYGKDFELRLKMMSQKWIDDETKQWAEWVANGSKPYKVEFAEGAKDNLKEIIGEDGANELFKDIEERNKQIDDETK